MEENIKIAVMRPSSPGIDLALPRLREVDRAAWFTNFGPQETELRFRLANFLEVEPEQVMTANSATSALAGAVAVSPAFSWRVPSFTFPASPSAVLLARKELLLRDIGSDWWIDEHDEPGTGIMAVAPFGDSVNTERWSQQGPVVIDAAASLGAPNLGLEHLNSESAIVFSLHATKVLGSGEGGVVVFGSPEFAAEFRAWTNFGFSGTRESKIVGTNAKMSESQACFAHAALDSWAIEKEEWLVARGLVEGAQERLGLRGPPNHSNPINPYWVVRFEDQRTTMAVEATLAKEGIQTRRWWSRGCHRMEAFKGFGPGPFTTTNEAAETSLGLPMYRGISITDVEKIERGVSRGMEVAAWAVS